ncbi:MAG: SIMPL domain-containing protein [Sphingorhabdus sp.]
MMLYAAVALATFSPVATSAAEIHIEAKNPVVELSVAEVIENTPDTATFSTGVETSAPTASAALRQNSAEVAKVIAQLQKLGIAMKDIQTSGINLNAEYDYVQATQKNRFKGYRVSNQVQVKIRDIDKLGAIMDAVVTSGATNINGPWFSIDNDSEVKKSARARALANGREQAETYAKANGYSSVRLLSVAEGITGRSPPQPMMKSFDVAQESASVPIAPGQIGTSVVLSLQYEMVR